MLDEDEEQFEKENVFREVCLSCASISTLDNENFLLVIFHIFDLAILLVIIHISLRNMIDFYSGCQDSHPRGFPRLLGLLQ